MAGGCGGLLDELKVSPMEGESYLRLPSRTLFSIREDVEVVLPPIEVCLQTT